MRASVDDVLRSEGAQAPGAPKLHLAGLVLALGVGGALYGAAMGAWSESPTQALYSAVKVPLLLTATSAVCLPNFYVLNTVLGLRDDMGAALRGILAAQATVALALASLALPILVLYAAGLSYPAAKLVNGGLFFLASVAGQLTLRRHYAPLIAGSARHRVTLGVWLILYQAVAIQLAWSLRPFIGSPDDVTTLFRAESFTNAYVEVVRAFRATLGSR